MASSNRGSTDFFISYTAPDSQWAEWIAWTLEENGYSTVIQAWDFRAGANFVVEMQQAAERATRTIAVLTPAYFQSSFGQPEWAAAFANDPQGLKRTLVPVVVEPIEASGLWGQIVHINLVGLDRETAQKKLLAELAPGRAKPPTAPKFPGPERTYPSPVIINPRLEGPQWQALPEAAAVLWRDDLAPNQRSSSTARLEIHMVPIGGERLEMRRLRDLPDQLAQIGRTRGLFGGTQGITPTVTEDSVTVITDPDRSGNESALCVTRGGQRTTWVSLPHDMLGSVLDPEETQARVSALLDLLAEIPMSRPGRVGFGVRVAPTTMLTIGDESVIGSRTSASMSFGRSSVLTVAPDDAVRFDALPGSSAAIAEELVARLLAAAGTG